MWIVELVSNSTFNLYDAFSQSHDKPPSDTSLNGSMDLKDGKLNYTHGIYTVTFERLLKTNDPFDYEIKIVFFYLY